jgi:hypothetical protein
MNFNTFIWDNFKESANGKKLIEFFSQYSHNIENKTNTEVYQGILNKINYEDLGIEDATINQHFEAIRNCVCLPNDMKVNGIKTEVSTFEEFENTFNFLITLAQGDAEKPFKLFRVDDIPFLSECLYFMYPKYCFPYYFSRLYHVVEAIFNEFGIFLPPPPKKTDEYKRMFHYVELCRSLYDFRIKFGMSEYELPAFLYGFAVEMVKKYEITDELPEPRKAYFIGGGKKDKTVDVSDDFAYLDEPSEATITNWQGNPETQPGDIIVMYCLMPRSYIHSIWRAVTPGSSDPFFHFYKNVYIGKPLFVKPIPFDELKKDIILSETKRRYYSKTTEIIR